MTERAGRRGPRPGRADTRGEILTAAGVVFSRDGYAKGSVRAIAREAGVDPGMVRHYFASKTELFVEAMRPPIDLSAHVITLGDGDPDQVGDRIMEFFLRVWDDPLQGPRIITLMRAALDHAEVAEFVRTLIIEGVVEKVAERVGSKDPRIAAATAVSQVFGLAMLRHGARIEPLASEPPAVLAARYGPLVTRILRDN